MTRDEVITKVGQVLDTILDDHYPIDELCHPLYDLGLDSLEVVDFVLGIQKTFGITVTDDEAVMWWRFTAGQIADAILTKLGVLK